MTSRIKKVLVGLAAIAALALGAGSIVQAVDAPPAPSETPAQDRAEDRAEGPDRQISGSALDRASAAALDHVGTGKVTGSERGDEESYYEIEVTRPDGGQVDVQLDRGFDVVSTEDDGAGEDD